MRFVAFLLLLSSTASAQIIPDDRRIQWQPGVPGGIPTVSTVCPANAPSVTSFGAVGDGTTNDYPAFEAALTAASPGSAIRVPAGTYLLRSGLAIDKGVVLCGAGSDQSRLHFDTQDTAISMVLYDRGSWVSVSSGYTKGSTTLVVSDGSSFVVGQYAELQQDNDWDLMDPDNRWRNESWVPASSVGQIFRVDAINNNTLTVTPPVFLDYNPTYNPEIRRLNLVVGAGLQSLYLRRLDQNDRATVEMKNCVGCWMRDCESENTLRSHVNLTSSLWCEVRDSYMHHAHDYGGGGHGYGTNLGTHTTACLIENNIFVHLRHSMLVQVGATGNVFGYNYSREPISEGSWTPCDISLHGHYPNMNLFEGNTVQEIDVSDYWGPCGPGNTFFRNRVEAEGIQVMDHSHNQNIVGSELTTGDNVIDVAGNVQGTLVHGNYEGGTLFWDPNISDHTLPVSYYRSQKPHFFGNVAWPVIGADLAPNTAKIPAELRYLGIEPSGPIFSPVPYFGDSRNYQPLTPTRWSVATDDGDERFFLNTSDFSDQNGGLGEYATITGRSFADFSLAVTAKSNEEISANPLADYGIVFGFVDANNYRYIMMNADAGETKLFHFDGSRTEIAAAQSAGIPDPNYHAVQVDRAGTTLTVRLDGTLLLSVDDPAVSVTGAIGLGSFNDSVYFDDIEVTESSPSDGGVPHPDATATDASTTDASTTDASTTDASTTDAATADTAVTDTTPGDAAVMVDGSVKSCGCTSTSWTSTWFSFRR